MHRSSSLLRFVRLFIVLSSILLAGCSTIKYGIYGMVLSHENWKAGLFEKTLNWNGRPISYLESDTDGTEPTIVMIHGFAANKETWVRFAGYLTDAYHVVAIDLPGHGESVKDLNMSYKWGDMVEYLHEILTQLNLKKFDLAGNSMGGEICGLYAVKYPDQVISLLLIDPGGVFRYESQLTRLLKKGKNPLIVKSKDDFKKLMNFVFVKKPYIPWPIVDVMAEKAIANQAINKKIFSDLTNDHSFVFEYEMKKIRVPTLIMWGAQDRVINVKNADVFKELIPNSQKVIFDGVGHAPMLEIPEQSAKVYRDFLSFIE